MTEPTAEALALASEFSPCLDVETIRRMALKIDAFAGRYVAALEQSVRLQSHYAGLLNDYDGGKRLTFEDANAWMDRLDALSLWK